MKMRKPVEVPSNEIEHVGIYAPFNGYFKDDIELLSDASIYEFCHDDVAGNSLAEPDSSCESDDVRTSNKAQTDVDRKKQLLRKPKKGTKLGASSEQRNESDSDSKADQRPRKFLKKPAGQSPSKRRHAASSATFHDMEIKAQKRMMPLQAMPKTRGKAQVEGEYRGEKGKIRKLKRGTSAARLSSETAQMDTREATHKAFQKRKKLCKAVELTSASKKGYKEKAMQVETRGNDFEAMSDSEAHVGMCAHESIREASSSKLVKVEDGRQGGEFSRGARQKMLPTSGHLSKTSKHDDVVGSSSTGKQPGKVGRPAFCAASLETVHSFVEHQRPVTEKSGDNGMVGEEVSSGVTEGADGNKERTFDEKGHNAELADTEVGWVSCDTCHKWRCVPAALADVLEKSTRPWYCKDNPDKKFADCCVPQEKSNAEINAELNISDVSFCEEGDERHTSVDSKLANGYQHRNILSGHSQSTFTLIKHNIFQHRQRKTITEDEQMVCSCAPPEDGRAGCGEDCYNRIVNIECVSHMCPCGHLCSNQQFQRRAYTKVGWFRCGKKGFGLQVLEDVSQGMFITEYVGEVLDMGAYEARQREYALAGQKHFYFMVLNSNEVIDACFKGNFGRFVNHSCEPNCRTEKWLVNGEVCIGIFAIRDLKKGEEITFDYNFVRVCGAAAKKCLCGSLKCRGYIGGDPTTPRAVVQSDSDDEDDPEPVMVEESSEEESRTEGRKQLVIAKKRDIKADVTSLEPCGKQVEELLDELVDENGGLFKGYSRAEEVADRYRKLLVLTAASNGLLGGGEGSGSTRDLSIVLDALLKTQSRAILMEVVNKNGTDILHKMIKKSRTDYKMTPIVRKLLKVLEFLAVKHILTPEQLNAEAPRTGTESIKDTIGALSRHADKEVQHMAEQFKAKWLKSNSQKTTRRNSSDLSKWRLFKTSVNDGTEANAASAAGEDEAAKKRKRSNRWDQPSQEVLDTTLAGGLPQSFWPFNANNLLLGNTQQSSILEQPSCSAEAAAADERGMMRPCPPPLPAIDDTTMCPPGPPGPPGLPPPVVPVDNQPHHADVANPGTGVPVVVSGIPVEQFTWGPSMGYMTPQGPVCIGIPVSQSHGSPIPGPNMPHMYPSVHQSDHHVHDGQALPSYSMDAQDQERHDYNAELSADQEPNVTFGISHSQFFQQMHRLFGSEFHPWQLQSLMAPHACGPYLSGDARMRDAGFAGDSGPMHRQPGVRGSDESTRRPIDLSPMLRNTHEGQPPVPGLSPPPPAPSLAHSPSSAQAPRRRPFANEFQGRANVSPKPFKSTTSWRPQKWNSSRFPKFHGPKFRNAGFRRDFGFSHQRGNEQAFPRQGPARAYRNWGDAAASRQPADRAWGGYDNPPEADHREANAVADGGPYGAEQNEVLADSYGNMPLERPWGYKQDETLERPWGYQQEQQYGGPPENYSAQFPSNQETNS